MCIRYLCVHSKPTLNTVQLLAYKVTMFHENTDLIIPGDSYCPTPRKYYFI